MSSFSTLAMSLVYLVPVALLAMLFTRPKRRTRIWIPVVLTTLPMFYIAHYLLLQQYQGWPSGEELPQSFRLIAHDINEPDPRHRDPGQIRLWIRSDNHRQPRAYSLPYSKALHQKLVDAARRQADGQPQRGQRHHASNAASSSEVIAATINFEDEQAPKLPSKGTGD